MTKRQTKLFDLRYDMELAVVSLRTIDRPAFLAHALWTIAENTSFAEDAKAIIEQCCPTYFPDPDAEQEAQIAS